MGVCLQSEYTLSRRRPGSHCVAGVALGAAALGGPVDETLEAVAVFPGEVEKFRGGKVVRLFTEECFKAPAEVRALPGLEAVTASNDPVIPQRSPHVLLRTLCPKLIPFHSFLGTEGGRKMLVDK